MKETLRSLRHRNFRLFLSGQLISLIGTWMQSIAEGWLLYQMTGSAALLGVLGFLANIPALFPGPIAGVFVDRHNKRKMIFATQSASMLCAFVLAALVFTGTVQVWHLLALALCLGLINTWDIPARQAFLFEMVGREDLMNAIALNSSMFNCAKLIGPAIGGILVYAFGEGWCFLINGISYFAVLASLALMKLEKKEEISKQEGLMQRLREGYHFIHSHHPIRDLLLLLGVVCVAVAPYSVLLPVFTDQILESGSRGYGILMSAAGLGALFAAISIASRRSFRSLGGPAGAAATGMGTFLIVFSFSKSFWLSAVALFFVGFFLMYTLVCINTLIQSMSPDSMRGRIMSYYTMMMMGIPPLGCLIVGACAEWIGAPSTVAISGGISILAGIVFLWNLPRFKEESKALLSLAQS